MLPASHLLRALALAAALAALTGCGVASKLAEATGKPARPFAQTAAPAAPDYDQPRAWMAFPGRGGQERSTPPGAAAVVEASAPADLFFIHPTTYLKNDVYNAAYDAPDDVAVYNAPVRLGQISAFNGCCRLYAPHYRQASLYSLNHSQAANELAFADVQRAFRWYIAHENHGRPFILASHSQGSMHAVELLQTDILGTPLQKQLVAAYVVGAYAPANFAEQGLPTCDSPTQTGCILSWNTSQAGRKGARMLIVDKTYWWKGGWRTDGGGKTGAPAICVNPLTWTQVGAAPASADEGALPFPAKPFPAGAITFAPLVPHLTGAECRDHLLYVDIGHAAPKGFHDALSLLYGSYHPSDYGIFYDSVRANAVARAAAWEAKVATP